jgi:hypothetical protein
MALDNDHLPSQLRAADVFFDNGIFACQHYNARHICQRKRRHPVAINNYFQRSHRAL